MQLEGLQLGRYHFLRLLGVGGPGEVYQAEDVLSGQQVAIKLLPVEDTSLAHGYEDGVAYDIFLREAMAIANLDHPHILPLYKYGEIHVEDSSFFYLVMPLCLDGTLAKWLERSDRSVQLSPLDAEHFVRQGAGALQYAHDHDIIHQDVKPSNFLLRPGKEDPNLPDLFLADFGCAEFIHATTTNAANRTIRGTPAYMAPEQWGGYFERATDQYALGVMSYQMLTAQLPFSALQEQNISLRTQPQAPSTLNPNLSTELDEVVLQALARRPQDRFPSIAAFAYAFQRAAQHRATSTVANTSDALGSKEITTQRSFPVTFGIPAVINRPRSRNFSWMRKVIFLALAILMVVVTVDLILFAWQNRGGVKTAAPSAALAVLTDPYTHTGTLKLEDPLSDNSQRHSWQENAHPGGAACRFTAGAYDVVQPHKGRVQTCFATSTDFGNFVYEVHVTIFTGDYAGIVFCADSAHGTFYYLGIGRDGRFSFSRYVDGDPAHVLVLLQGHASFIQTGVHQANVLAVVVQSGSIHLYVNQQKIGSYDDSSYTHGQIGVFAGSTANATNVAFSKVKVWQL